MWFETLGPETFDDHVATFQIHPDPVTTESLAHVIGRPAAAEWIQDQIAFLGGHLDDPFEDLGGQLIQCALAALEFPVPDRGDVIPYVGQGYSVRIHRPSVTSIILDLPAAVTACLDGRTDFPEGICPSLGEIQKAIMGWI